MIEPRRRGYASLPEYRRPPSRARRFALGLAIGEPVAVRMTLLAIVALAVLAAVGHAVWSAS